MRCFNAEDVEGGVMELAPVHFSRFDYIRDYRFLDPAPLAPKAVRCHPSLRFLPLVCPWHLWLLGL